MHPPSPHAQAHHPLSTIIHSCTVVQNVQYFFLILYGEVISIKTCGNPGAMALKPQLCRQYTNRPTACSESCLAYPGHGPPAVSGHSIDIAVVAELLILQRPSPLNFSRVLIFRLYLCFSPPLARCRSAAPLSLLAASHSVQTHLLICLAYIPSRDSYTSSSRPSASIVLRTDDYAPTVVSISKYPPIALMPIRRPFEYNSLAAFRSTACQGLDLGARFRF
jgi:hypothetical protein